MLLLKGTSGDKHSFPDRFCSRKKKQHKKEEKNTYFCGGEGKGGEGQVKKKTNTKTKSTHTALQEFSTKAIISKISLTPFFFSNPRDNKSFLNSLTQNTVHNDMGKQGFNRQWQSWASAGKTTGFTTALPPPNHPGRAWQHLLGDASLVNTLVPSKDIPELLRFSTACPREGQQGLLEVSSNNN